MIATPAPKPLLYCMPESEKVDDHIVNISAHPSQDLLAVGDIAGKISLYSYEVGEECHKLASICPRPCYSCRVLHFSKTGQCKSPGIFSGSSQKGTLFCSDTTTRALLHTISAHSAPLYSMLPLSDRLLATGDEAGEIKLWDLRSWKQVCKLKANEDFISDMVVNRDYSTLLATSGDGTLTVLDLRQRKLQERSDPNESELLSLAIVKSESKVVCGDGEGALMIYNWGLWSDITDRYPVHPQAIDCLLALNSSVICTGCMDGWVRSVQILPNELLGSVGKHPSEFPVENMCLSHDRKYVVTCSQDSCHFWPASDIPMLPSVGGATRRRSRKRKQKHRDLAAEESVKTKRLQQKDFFADLCS